MPQIPRARWDGSGSIPAASCDCKECSDYPEGWSWGHARTQTTPVSVSLCSPGCRCSSRCSSRASSTVSCRTSSETCCSRSRLVSRSCRTRACASIRAAVSAASWSFSSCTCKPGRGDTNRMMRGRHDWERDDAGQGREEQPRERPVPAAPQRPLPAPPRHPQGLPEPVQPRAGMRRQPGAVGGPAVPR